MKTVNIPKLLCFEVDMGKNDEVVKDERRELIDRIQGKLKIVGDQEKQIKELQQQIKEQRDFFEH